MDDIHLFDRVTKLLFGVFCILVVVDLTTTICALSKGGFYETNRFTLKLIEVFGLGGIVGKNFITVGFVYEITLRFLENKNSRRFFLVLLVIMWSLAVLSNTYYLLMF